MTLMLAITRAVHFCACLLPLSVFTTMLLSGDPAGSMPAETSKNVPATVAAAFLPATLRYLLAGVFRSGLRIRFPFCSGSPSPG